MAKEILLKISDEAIDAQLDKTINDLKQISKESKKTGESFKAGIGSGAKYTKDFNKATREATKSAKQMGDSVEKANSKLKESSSELKNMARNTTVFGVSVGAVEEKFKSLARVFSPVTNGIKKMLSYVGNFKVFGTSINGVSGQIAGMARNINTATGATRAMTVGFKALKAALLSTGIGALVVALGSLAAYFTQTQKGADALSRAFTGVNAAISVVLDRLANFGGTLIDVFRGDASFGDLVKSAKDALTGFGEEVRAESAAAAALQGQLQNVRDAQAALTVQYAEARAEIKEYNKIAEDTNKSLNERADAARKAIDLEQGFVDKQLELLEKEKEAQEGLNALGISKFEDEQRVRDLQIEIAQKRQESLELQTTLNNKLNVIEDARRRNQEAILKAQQAARDEYEKLAEQVVTLAIQAQVESTEDPLKKAKLEYDNTKKAIDELRAQVIKAAEEAGVDTTELDSQFAALYAQAQAKFAAATNAYLDEQSQESDAKRAEARQLIKELQAEADANAAALAGPYAELKYKWEQDLSELELVRANLDKQFGEGLLTEEEYQAALKNVDRLTAGVNERFNEGVKDLEGSDPWAFITDGLKKAFNISDAEFNAIVGQLGNTIGAITDSIGANIQAQLDANQELIDAIRERRETVEEELDRELRAAELGYANNVQAKKEELKEIEKEEVKAQKKALELKKKAANQQLAIEAAQQATGLTTTVVNVLANQSLSGGVAGLLIGLAAVSTLLATFASIKKRAAAATAPVRLYKGGAVGEAVRDFGIVQPRGGRSDVPGRNEGHMVEGTNLMLGGHEFVHKESVSREHLPFFKHLNENEHLYRGHDLKELFLTSSRPDIDRINRDYRHDSKVIAKVERVKSNELLEKAITAAIKEQTKDLITHADRKEETHFVDGKMVTITRDRNGKVINIKDFIK